MRAAVVAILALGLAIPVLGQIPVSFDHGKDTTEASEDARQKRLACVLCPNPLRGLLPARLSD